MKSNNSIISDYTSTDDAAAVRLDDGRILLQTVDFFTPIVDDPYLFGQISAANSLSDIYAMGGKPLFALNIVAFPIQKLEKSILSEIMQGGADKANEAGVPIVGGHSVDDSEPKYGLVVTGEVEENSMWTNTGAKPGDSLVLTKAIGTGIISTAIKKEKTQDSVIKSAVESMKMLNKNATETLQAFNPSAVTDVTGFGLIGHLMEMCKNSRVTAEINFSDIKLLPGAIELANDGIMPGGVKTKFRIFRKIRRV
jgi:selenium donor protein